MMTRNNVVPRIICSLLTSTLASVLLVGTLVAQSTAPERPLPTQAITIQPLSLIVGAFGAEYERKISTSTTFGVGGNYWDESTLAGADDGDANYRYVSGEVKLRYYPGAKPLRGFSVGGTFGFVSVKEEAPEECTDFLCFEPQSYSGPKAGIEIDYNWLLGRTDQFVVALGAGAKRLFVDVENDFGFIQAYPTVRISIGYAF